MEVHVLTAGTVNASYRAIDWLIEPFASLRVHVTAFRSTNIAQQWTVSTASFVDCERV